ncbi:putative serine peptidase Clan S- family S54 [Leptomonas pyrrhocoris]|uniref:Putative serine peptidase Clan S-family S54 n=1 Tax=Leptomonas pyrrhocoris TaxID=157538 RepID=A0A0M9FSH3_LEPPY|nr:putative serine peptidase Clan S- family S54 [Leptomonas pyrrhocoris]XP_015653382.1 putative serine peptidase Clan S- family S54 [Leptomonas pyrrhocoris]XP_015653383.1 putative serine peptidase Clan S- family S54 [Leptomonas pyrrhocoris]XP_015653384.1 putative serine peptidase Clan S- family S54 [Leptomonas pyrrhocoris]XP_015653385.1 putative serine peptidase Clan S- family S54 [Leptomonas pyrrhocoris]KPA74942.1 putative serine peptidase Clan S- family S54 [Leptomonas pyrrhocoris]KPA74943.|eukprot:XP_015653381.1 putative serine peptidase Clan S- family S54 [Leptomonas pyrrhocoris]
MRVDPFCTVIRFAPIGVLIAVHCSNGHWPSDEECAERVIRAGFCVDLVRERPLSVVTHLFIHISSQHLLSNICSFAATLLEYGDVPVPTQPNADGDDDDHAATADGNDEYPTPASQRHGSVGAQMRALWCEHSPAQACLRTVGVFAVWLIGGALGGLGGQLLYNDSTVMLRRERAARAVHAVRESQSASSPSSSEGGVPVLSTLSRHARVLRQRAEAMNSTFAAAAQQAVNNAMMMCGASAGICALSGFNAVYYGRPVTALCMVVPEVVALSADVVNHYMALLAPNNGSSGSPALDAQRKALRSTWRTLMPGQVVGHAAHVGGFVAGAGIGYAWLWVQKRRLRHAQSRRRARK